MSRRKEAGPPTEFETIEWIVRYECPVCGKRTDSPQEVGKAGIGFHENARSGGTCAGVGSRPRAITKTTQV